MAISDGLSLGQSGALSSSFSEAAGYAKVDFQQLGLSPAAQNEQSIQVADANKTDIGMHNGKYFPVSPDSGRLQLHAGPDKQGFRTTPHGPGKGFSG